MRISTKTGKITLFCGCKGALIFLFLRAERKKLPQKRVKLPFFVEVGYFFLLRGGLKRLFCGDGMSKCTFWIHPQRCVRMSKMQGAEDEDAGSVLKYMTKPESDSNAADWLL